jgi:hemerythrin-like domain-containing protein
LDTEWTGKPKVRHPIQTSGRDYGELFLYDMRHVQQQTVRVDLILRQFLDRSSTWVFRAKKDSSKEAGMKPRGQLMIEHRLIEKYLALAAESTESMTESRFDPVPVDTIVDFIKTYADRTHHGKEEDILFQKLSERKISADDFGVMDELIDEHKQAREKVRKIEDLNDQFKNGNKKVVSQIKEIILWLADFYPIHIKKEDKDFFPKSEKYLSEEELKVMLEGFREFDRQMIHEKYQGIYERLSRTSKK